MKLSPGFQFKRVLISSHSSSLGGTPFLRNRLSRAQLSDPFLQAFRNTLPQMGFSYQKVPKTSQLSWFSSRWDIIVDVYCFMRALRLCSPPEGLTFTSSSDDGDDGDGEGCKTRITYSDANSDFRVKHWAFPKLDGQIRQCIEDYEGVFPKLNFSSPKVNSWVSLDHWNLFWLWSFRSIRQDAYWVLFNANPLRCTSPSDVYILLKSSDFVTHDTDTVNVFSGCVDLKPGEEESHYELELILRKWYSIERNREVRCFVRNRRLIGESFFSCIRHVSMKTFFHSPTPRTGRVKLSSWHLWRSEWQLDIPVDWYWWTMRLLSDRYLTTRFQSLWIFYREVNKRQDHPFSDKVLGRRDQRKLAWEWLYVRIASVFSKIS